ncbi:alpha/beta fold hydrolase [Mycobacterium marseillense]|uniref:alpha/beta fold hydrolase n=1 Tax=Mycobacterium marseillense TaxID=701042 RepID=UPI000A5AAC25|nr:alpha/beta hydrolase [Mycobacterium marseillense]
MRPVPTYVLIPGGWHAAWCWWPVAKRLRAAGHRSIALTLPGLNDGEDPSGYRLTDAVDYVVSQVRGLELDVILVAHSWGGYPATGAAALLAEQVSKVIYFNALVPVCGKSLVDDHPPAGRDLLLQLINHSPDGAIAPTLAYVEELFMQDTAPILQRMVADLLTPQPGGYFLDALHVDPAALTVPTAYIASENDCAPQWSAAEFASRLGVEPVYVPGTHLSMLTHPDEVAEAIMAA